MTSFSPAQVRRLLGTGALLAVIISVYLWEAHTLRIVEPTVAKTGDQGAYLKYARLMQETHYSVIGTRNRMPAYPFLLSFIYRPGMSEPEFLRRAQAFNVNLSAALLVLLFVLYRRHFPPLSAFALLAMAAFGVFFERAPFAQVELLFYVVSFVVFLSLWRMLVAPRVWLALWTGAIVGLAHLTKASVLPALAVFTVAFAAKACWEHRRTLPRQALLLGLVLATFLAVIFPYIQNSKRIYGHYFYNVNSTFYLWCDSWQEAKALTRAHGDRQGWPALPPEQIPSAGKYWREHSVAQIAGRLGNGYRRFVMQNVEGGGYYKYVMLLVVALGATAFARRPVLWQRIRALPFLAAFFLLFFAGYVTLFAWYTPLSADPRFLLTIFLPFTFTVWKFITRLGQGISIKGIALIPALAALLIVTASAEALYRAWSFTHPTSELLRQQRSDPQL